MIKFLSRVSATRSAIPFDIQVARDYGFSIDCSLDYSFNDSFDYSFDCSFVDYIDLVRGLGFKSKVYSTVHFLV